MKTKHEIKASYELITILADCNEKGVGMYISAFLQEYFGNHNMIIDRLIQTKSFLKEFTYITH